MSHLPRSLMTRLARLEAQRSRTVPQPVVLVPLYEGETHATALQAAGYTSEEVAGRLVVFSRRFSPREQAGDPSVSLI